MGKIIKAGAWCNGEVAYLAWRADAPIAECLGFMITRVHETGSDAGVRRILPTWIAFTDQSNPQWLAQDSSVWPIQQFEWRDLTLRQSRDTTSVRPIDFKVHYEIVPVGLPGAGRTAVPASATAVFTDASGSPRYVGTPRPLAILDVAFPTPSIEVTHDYGPGTSAAYTNGILSTQNLLQQLESIQATKPSGVKPGPTRGITPGLLKTLKDHLPLENDPLRLFLTGDVLSFLEKLLTRAEKTQGGVLYLALYELHDPELIRRLLKLVQLGKAHLILSTAGSTDVNPKTNPPLPKQPIIWDTENHPARKDLHAAHPVNVQDRLFNNQAHIGHNKFTVYVENGSAKAVLTGSTNWTETGLCTQSNNALLIEDDKVAALYLDYWGRLHADPQPVGVELTAQAGKVKASGFAGSAGVQGAKIRADNAAAAPAVTLADGTSIEVLFSPNTVAKTKTGTSPTPSDLQRVYDRMKDAKDAILFLTFLPGIQGQQNIIGQAAALATLRPNLLVQGAISDPSALPPQGNAGMPTTYTKPDGSTAKLPQQAIWWPDGQDSRVVMIRAAAITEPNGDLRPELLTAGHAIIHDKIIVLDPLDPVNCTVITGSHNLGYKASYQNDENLLIIQGNQALAVSYAIHVLDVYDHYVMRAKLQDELRKSLIATGKAPVASSGGFLKTTDAWQDRWMQAARPPSSAEYFLK